MSIDDDKMFTLDDRLNEMEWRVSKLASNEEKVDNRLSALEQMPVFSTDDQRTSELMLEVWAYDREVEPDDPPNLEVKQAVKDWLKDLFSKGAVGGFPSQYCGCFMAHVIKMEFLSKRAIEEGATLEDACLFIKWLDEEMGLNILAH